MDEAEMATLNLLKPRFKLPLILGFRKIIWEPISQRGKRIFFSRMIVIIIHEILKAGFHAEGFGIEMPGRARFHLDRKGAYPSHIGVTIPNLVLELKGLLDILCCLKGNTDGEEDIAENPMPFQLVQAVHQSLIGVGMSFVDFSQSIGSHIWRKGDERLRPWKGFFEGFDKIGSGKSERLEETFHLDSFLPDARKELQKILRVLGRRVETDVEGFIPIGERLLDRLEDLLDPPKGDLLSASDRHLGRDVSTTPGAPDRTTSAYGEVIDGRLQ
jgi:hypothetical protein